MHITLDTKAVIVVVPDKIVGVKICKDDQDVILSTKFGKCIRFEAKKLRVFKGKI